MSHPQQVRRYTPDEYYRLERNADHRSEFYDGEIFAMAGGSARHSQICANILRHLGNKLERAKGVGSRFPPLSVLKNQSRGSASLAVAGQPHRPGRSLRVQRRNEPGCVVEHPPPVGPRVVAAGEYRLEVQSSTGPSPGKSGMAISGKAASNFHAYTKKRPGWSNRWTETW